MQETDLSASWVARRARASAPASIRPTNYARSAFHVSAAAVGLAAVTLLPTRGWILVAPAVFSVYAWSMEAARRFSPRLNDRLMRLYSAIAHPRERHQVNSATWFGTALVILALFATRPAMAAGVAVLGVADPIAGLVGRRWGRHRIRAGRSLEGSLAFLVSGTLAAVAALALVRGGSPLSVLGLAALAGLTGAIVELVSTRLDDNLTIPLAVGTAITAATWVSG